MLIKIGLRRFDVSMNNPIHVKVFYSTCRLENPFEDLIFGEFAFRFYHLCNSLFQITIL